MGGLNAYSRLSLEYRSPASTIPRARTSPLDHSRCTISSLACVLLSMLETTRTRTGSHSTPAAAKSLAMAACSEGKEAGRLKPSDQCLNRRARDEELWVHERLSKSPRIARPPSLCAPRAPSTARILVAAPPRFVAAQICALQLSMPGTHGTSTAGMMSQRSSHLRPSASQSPH
eukprot:scaffold136823_cov33-Tisochrysis_lutea.AAC.3